jgi:hypothetical protein
VSWLRRLFGGDEDGGEARPDAPAELGYVTDGRKAADAKQELLRVLRELGARSALLVYDGGHDEGGVTEIFVSSEPLDRPAEEWREATLPASTAIDMDRAWNAWGADGAEGVDPEDRRLSELMDAVDAFLAAKWDTFAGEFEVEGRVVVDVDDERIARHDVVTVEEDGGEPMRETEVV